jgi:hypothetical protein
MDYGNVLSRAWNIVWANKWLFILGFLAALGSGGSSGSSNFRTNIPSGSSDFQPPADIFDNLGQFAPIIGALVCFFILLGIGLWLLRLIGEAGLIASVDRIEGGQKLTFGEGFRAGTGHLKNMIVLSLMLYGPFLLVGLLVFGGGALLAVGSAAGGSGELLAGGIGLILLCLIPLGCLMAIAGLIISFIYPMAQRSIIITGLDVMDGIRHGWQVLRTNLIEIFILAVIFVLIGFMVGLASLIIVVPLALISVIPVAIAVIQGGEVLTVAAIILGAIGVLAFILLSAAITSIVRTFQSTSFTLAYHQWAGKEKSVPAL